MGERFTDTDGSVWEAIEDGPRFVKLRNVDTHEIQEVSIGELRDYFDRDDYYSSTDEAW
jgi:hypothetical protein